MANPWLVHLAAFRKSHPKLSAKECMVEAAKTYKKKEVEAKAPKSKVALVKKYIKHAKASGTKLSRAQAVKEIQEYGIEAKHLK